MTAKSLQLLFIMVLFPLTLAAEQANSAPALDLIHSLGCKACHKLDGQGGSLASELDHIGSRKTRKQISEHLADHQNPKPDAFMPSYNTTSPEQLELLSDYLYNLQ